MREHDIRVHTTDVGDRYVLEALQREGALLGGEQSGHVIYLRDHVTGDGLAAGLLLCGALKGRTLSEAASVMSRWPQHKENVPVTDRELTPDVLDEVDRLNRAWNGRGPRARARLGHGAADPRSRRGRRCRGGAGGLC